VEEFSERCGVAFIFCPALQPCCDAQLTDRDGGWCGLLIGCGCKKVCCRIQGANAIGRNPGRSRNHVFPAFGGFRVTQRFVFRNISDLSLKRQVTG